MLVNILAVSWPEVGKTAALYGAVDCSTTSGGKFAIPRTRSAEREGISIRLWDFLFRRRSIVVTSSVAIAGVLPRVLLPDCSVHRMMRRDHR